MQSYLTIKESGTYEVSIQKSRFIGHMKRVESEDEAQTFIQAIRKKHHDATHNCYAYIIGDKDQHQKANDDGEPSGTAGIPMLEVLKKQALKNVVIVITRYFGGIKLGAGGLIRAYSSVTSDTIHHIGIVKGELMQGYSVKIAYPLLGKLENAINNSPYIKDDIYYLEDVELIIYVPIEKCDTFEKEMINLTNDQLTMTKTDQKYLEREVKPS